MSLTVTSELRFDNGDVRIVQPSSNVRTPSSAALPLVKRVSVTTSAAAIDFTGLTEAKEIEITNLDPTNYVKVGPDNAGTMVELNRLQPGDSCRIQRVAGATIKWQANGGTCIVQMMACDT